MTDKRPATKSVKIRERPADPYVSESDSSSPEGDYVDDSQLFQNPPRPSGYPPVQSKHPEGQNRMRAAKPTRIGRKHTISTKISLTLGNLIWMKQYTRCYAMFRHPDDTVSGPAQQVNQSITEAPSTTSPIPAVRGGIDPPDGEHRLSDSTSLTMGPMAVRTSSLTHISQTGALPQSTLSAFYQDFLRRLNAPARHEVVSEEVGDELLTDSSMVGRYGSRHRRNSG